MNLNGNFVLWCILLLTNHFVLTEARECVQRRLGACKVLQLSEQILLNDFHSPQPKGFALKTSIEINLLENKHSVENNLPVESRRPIEYNLENAALVTIKIRMDDWSFVYINLGKKYYRLAELQYFDDKFKLRETKYISYTPILPTFPYNLNLEMTTNGTLSVYADANTEPFLQYQLDTRAIIESIRITAPPDQTDLIAFVDCSEKYKPNCGSHRVDRLYGCREWLVEENFYGAISDFEGFQKTYEKDVLFDEFVVVDITGYSSKMVFGFPDSLLEISFKASNINAKLYQHWVFVKDAAATKWPIIPGGLYAVRVLIKNGTNNNRLTISNIRGDEMLSLSLCGVKGSLQVIEFSGPKFYFDCLHPDDERSEIMSERPRKTNEKDDSGDLTYHENGYNFSKIFLDTLQFISAPFVLYEHKFGTSADDWCEGQPKPKLFLTTEEHDSPLQSVIKSSNKALLSELEKIGNTTSIANKALLSELQQIGAQINATADANIAILTELKKLGSTADTNAAVLSKLQSVEKSIDALAIHLERNTTTVNYNYYNQLNVTEFLKLLKQN